MRRIYDSDAIERDDRQPFTPRERSLDDIEPQSFRSITSSAWSDKLLPHRVRCRAVRVGISVPQSTFSRGEPVPFRIVMRNRWFIPVSIRTVSPLLWTWSVDGLVEASAVPLRHPPDEESKLRFARGERLVFQRQWNGRFKVDDREWVPADPGEYELAVWINAVGGRRANLEASTTITIEP